MKKIISICSVVLIGASLAACGSNTSHKESDNDNNKVTVTKKESTVSSKKESKTVTYNDEDQPLAVSDEKKYTLNYTDSSWSPATIKIDKVQVCKLLKPYTIDSGSDGKYDAQGIVRIHFDITANRDCSLYPLQGTYNFNNGEQHEDADSPTSWDGDFNKGANKQGWVSIPVKQLNNVNDIKNIRVKFDGSYNTDNIDDNNSSHTYDFTLNLQ